MYIQTSSEEACQSSIWRWEGSALERAQERQPQVSLNRRIKNHILRRIDCGEWKAGHRVPSEMALAQQFSASRMTVNRAIRELAVAGRLERVQGIGTFVADQAPMAPLFEIRSIAREIELRNGVHSCEVIEADAVPAGKEAVLSLDLPPDETVFRLIALHRCDGVPLQFERRLVNPSLAPDFLAQDFTRVTASDYLLENVPFTEVEHLVDAIALPATVASLLGVDVGQPCLRLVRTTLLGIRKVTHVELIHPGSSFRLGGRFGGPHRAGGQL